MIPLPGAVTVVHGDVVIGAAVESPHFTVLPTFEVMHPELGVEDLSDRLLSFDITASIDESVTRAVFTLARGSGSTNLSPLAFGSSYNAGSTPILDPGVVVFLSLVINDVGVGGYIWAGRIDNIDVGGERGIITIRCRDMGSLWLNSTINSATWIESDDVEVVLAELMALGDQIPGFPSPPKRPMYWQPPLPPGPWNA